MWPATGLPLAGSFLGLVTAHIFAATPYVVGTLVSVLQRFDTNLEEASLSLGASRTATFAQVTLPMLKPGIFAGALYAFMISFSEVPDTPRSFASYATSLLYECQEATVTIKTVSQERGRLVRVLGTAPDSRGRGVRAPDDIAFDRQF